MLLPEDRSVEVYRLPVRAVFAYCEVKAVAAVALESDKEPAATEVGLDAEEPLQPGSLGGLLAGGLCEERRRGQNQCGGDERQAACAEGSHKDRGPLLHYSMMFVRKLLRGAGKYEGQRQNTGILRCAQNDNRSG